MRGNLIEAKGKPNTGSATLPWGISESAVFFDTFKTSLKIFADLETRLTQFIDRKKDNPLSSPYGKHDRPMTGMFAGFWHAHLRDDAIIIYLLKNRCIHLVCIVPHADLEGKRQKSTHTRLKSAGELPESLSSRIMAVLSEGSMMRVELFPNGISLKVWKNPTHSQFIKLISTYHILRGLSDRFEDFYVWDAAVAIHFQISDALSLESRYEMLLNSSLITVEYEIPEKEIRNLPGIIRVYGNSDFDIVNDNSIDY